MNILAKEWPVACLGWVYHRHIAVEDQDLFPMARRLLTPTELGAIGHEMAARRDDTIDGASRIGVGNCPDRPS